MVEKWFSNYAEYLYRLPPVFIGTDEELDQTLSDLYNRRQLDVLHKNDIWFNDWHLTGRPPVISNVNDLTKTCP
ncbi:MAG: hypothetical protein A3F12_05260 [Gammaproteobacteria bacterium RIFCSPHIGHO2_12_FULL_38_14]|nr:MAG: hypothetical protein A3F12_05260 [Gammaproteobacteria bacterium RIFCSPHIGHO2_12_FULL_38_14]